jgi:cell fate regulator YaaT (PSP1 superfamily)
MHECNVTGQYMLQVGAMGAIGRFEAVDQSVYSRGEQVICRTSRGLEVGRVMSASLMLPTPDGELLRRLTIEDQLLISRLQQHREEAFLTCEQLLAEHASEASLVDVEHLFDGQTVVFYFLGEIDSATQEITSKLAASYEKTVRFRKFSETLHEGCGPDCGTAAPDACGSHCSSCGVAAACGSRHGESG